MCKRRQVERLRKMIPRSCKNSSTAMARIQVPKKGTFTCDSSTAEEAVEYLQQVSLGCGWIWCASRKKNKLSKKWRFPIRGRTPKSFIYKFGFPLWTIQLLGYQMSTFGLWLGSGFAIFSVKFLIDGLIILYWLINVTYFLIDDCQSGFNYWWSFQIKWNMATREVVPRSTHATAPQAGWALARQRAAVLWSTEVGTQTAAAGIQCRFCALWHQKVTLWGPFRMDIALHFIWIYMHKTHLNAKLSRFVFDILRNLDVILKKTRQEVWRRLQQIVVFTLRCSRTTRG